MDKEFRVADILAILLVVFVLFSVAAIVYTSLKIRPVMADELPMLISDDMDSYMQGPGLNINMRIEDTQ